MTALKPNADKDDKTDTEIINETSDATDKAGNLSGPQPSLDQAEEGMELAFDAMDKALDAITNPTGGENDAKPNSAAAEEEPKENIENTAKKELVKEGITRGFEAETGVPAEVTKNIPAVDELAEKVSDKLPDPPGLPADNSGGVSPEMACGSAPFMSSPTQEQGLAPSPSPSPG